MTWLNLEWATLQLAHLRAQSIILDLARNFFFNNISKIYLAQICTALAKNDFKWYAMSLSRGWGYKCLVHIFHCIIRIPHLVLIWGRKFAHLEYLTGWATSCGFINFAKAALKLCEIAIIPFMHYICVRKKVKLKNGKIRG